MGGKHPLLEAALLGREIDGDFFRAGLGHEDLPSPNA
jgi:hypothetical protein